MSLAPPRKAFRVKKIPRRQSRRNIDRRRRRVAARHNLAGHWGARPRPMFSADTVQYEVDGSADVTAFGGLPALHRLVTKLGLVEQIDERLQLLKVHLPYHESDHVLNLAYNVATGGKRLEDIERLRHDVAYMNALGAELIPDPTTAGDFCRRFSEDDVVTLMEAINTVRPKLWQGRAKDLLGPIAYIDIDGTDAPTDGEHKQGIGLSYKGIWGYGPLICSLANTRETLFIVNRPANAPSHQGAAEWIDKSIELVSPHAPRVCLRGDTDFALTEHFDRWAEKVDFIFGVDAMPNLVSIAEALPNKRWKPLARKPKYQTLTDQTRARRPNHKQQIVAEREFVNLRLNSEQVAEFTYRPGKCRRDYRVVVVRKNITKAKGEQALFDEIRYLFYITTRTDLTAPQVVACANERCDDENNIEQLKNGVNALRVPLYDLVSNWAYMVIAALAWNIKSWFAMMMHHKTDRRAYIRMEYRRFLREIVQTPARVIRHARTTTIRLVGYTRSTAAFFTAQATIEASSFR
jgi:hypothetical protein